MFRGLYRLLVAARDWRLRDVLVTAIGAEVVVLLAAIGLGFGTFAAYTHLAASEGRVYAALMMSAAYGVTATLGGIGLWLWHSRSARRRPATPDLPDTLEPLLRSLAAGSNLQDPMVLIGALREGRDLSPTELLAVSLIGGFLAGRSTGK